MTFLLEGSPSQFKKIIFQEDFSSALDKEKWSLYKSSSKVMDGVLVGVEEKGGGHAAVHGTKGLPEFSDVEVSLRLKFNGSHTTNLAFNDKGYPEVHAGHICRVVLQKKQAILKDGKTGIFRKDIFTKKREQGKLDKKTMDYVLTKQKKFPITLKDGVWYQVKILIKDDKMEFFIDNKLIGAFESEGIAHLTKDNFAIVTSKEEVHYDDVVIRVP